MQAGFSPLNWKVLINKGFMAHWLELLMELS